MTETPAKAPLALAAHNPDVLTCIANLSNDEVFTPPEFANRMLDTLELAWAEAHDGASIWADPTVTFLDPFTKSGVFLREITARLTKGLEGEIPELRERVDHILTKQVFGIGITSLTALLARRSVYCSKDATGEHSIASSFDRDWGNIWFERTEHTWAGAKCAYCSAPRDRFDRDDALETHAYAFVHTHDVAARLARMFGADVKFDVIIGNPPYQMAGGAGGSSDSSIYQLFVEQAIRMEPRFLSMVIPSRWMAGGRGLDAFRAMMLTEGKVRSLVDFPDAGEAFPGVQVKGGICYFLWDDVHAGMCDVVRVEGGIEHRQPSRDLGEFDVFVRDERAIGILHKVLGRDEKSVVELVSGDTPFGIATNFTAFVAAPGPGTVALHRIGQGRRTVSYVEREQVRKNTQQIDAWKLLVPKAYGAGESFPHQILGREIVASPPSVCTQSYLTIAPFASEAEATSFASYYRTRLFRFLVSLRKITQDALRSTYTWVPRQSWDRIWTDAELYAKYGITDDEIAFIESVVRPMELNPDA
ncbi:Eco57I restriction-modification methylase domain-containing protein [Protaetiibacter larvae]|uniref:site-specific DNA-methyltransferase (adenine-specific) n=1 Tax=Protaetiibacter larvae TaxID=2592654 RepID=A0A5C1Y423_9MICO|nr:Eco57I restriction-modification methylase domain-containing protein [Protaetiibacter larvae]QEO08763.1 restriction endonuclease [Protaetiibacter larvae]